MSCPQWRDWRCQSERRIVEQRLAEQRLAMQTAITPPKRWSTFKIIGAMLLLAVVVMLLGGPLAALVSIVLLAKAAFFVAGALILFKLIQGGLVITTKHDREPNG
jgi:hypothetical protein